MSVKFGSGYQLAGAGEWVTYTDNTGIVQGQFYMYHSQHFIKIPLDLSFSFGKELRWSIALGAYYNHLIHSAQNPEDIIVVSPLLFEKNYIGARLSTGYDIKISETASIQLGLLFEHSFFSEIPGEQYNIYLNAGLKINL